MRSVKEDSAALALPDAGGTHAPYRHCQQQHHTNVTSSYSAIALSAASPPAATAPVPATMSEAASSAEAPSAPASIEPSRVTIAMMIEERIQALPQELQDQILEQTLMNTFPPLQPINWSHERATASFTPLNLTGRYTLPHSHPDWINYRKYRKNGEIVYERVREDSIPARSITVIELSYKPPLALQISRKTRYNMAKLYYSTRSFFQAQRVSHSTRRSADAAKKNGALLWEDSLTRQHRQHMSSRIFVSERRFPTASSFWLGPAREERPGDRWIPATWSGGQADLRTPGRWAIRDEKLPFFFALPPEPLDMEIQALPQTIQDRILEYTLLATLPRPKKLTWSGNKCEWEVSCLVKRKPGQRTSYSNNGSIPSPIWHRVVTSCASPSMVLPIDEDYKPPAALHVNRATREVMARKFYDETIFYSDETMRGGLLGGWHSSKMPRKGAGRDWIVGVADPYRGMLWIVAPKLGSLAGKTERYLDGKDVRFL